MFEGEEIPLNELSSSARLEIFELMEYGNLVHMVEETGLSVRGVENIHRALDGNPTALSKLKLTIHL